MQVATEGGTTELRTLRSKLLAPLGVLSAILLALYLMGALAAPAGAAATGNAGVVDPTDSAIKINSGGSATGFKLLLPLGSTCSQDTASGHYHVFGYLLDSAGYPDPGAVSFDSNGPVGDGTRTAQPLYDIGQSPYVNAATAQTTGLVINIPTVSFDLFSVDERPTPNSAGGTLMLPTGTYNVGVACAKPDGKVDRFWNATMKFAAAAGDPTGEAWTVTSDNGTPPPPPPSSSTTTSTTVAPTTTSTTAASGSTTTSTTVASGSTTTSTTNASGSTTSTSVDPDSTTSTTDGGTTTTTAPGPSASTTTTSGGSLFGSGSPSGQVGGAVVASGVSDVTGAELPNTGRSPVIPVLAGAGLVYVGYVAILLARRRRPATIALLNDHSSSGTGRAR